MFSLFGRRTTTNARNTRNPSKNNRPIGKKVADYITSHPEPDFEKANELLNKALEATIEHEKSKVQKSQGYGDTRRAKAYDDKNKAIGAAAEGFEAAVKAHMRMMGSTAAVNKAGRNAAKEVRHIFKNKKNNSGNNTRRNGNNTRRNGNKSINRNNTRPRHSGISGIPSNYSYPNNASITGSNTRPSYSGRPFNYR